MRPAVTERIDRVHVDPVTVCRNVLARKIFDER
jgi:hypothetical protein